MLKPYNMKKYLLLIGLVLLAAASQAQLENTQWWNRMLLEEPTNVIMRFKKDTVTVYTAADNSVVEVMAYTVKNGQLTIRKLEGKSDCGDSIPGVYKISQVSDKLQLAVVSDDCTDRSSVLDKSTWRKWELLPEKQLPASLLQQYTGVYALDDAHKIKVTLENGRLFAEGPENNLPKSPLLAQTDTQFMLEIAGIKWEFVKDAAGKVIKLVSYEDKAYELKKR